LIIAPGGSTVSVSFTPPAPVAVVVPPPDPVVVLDPLVVVVLDPALVPPPSPVEPLRLVGFTSSKWLMTEQAPRRRKVPTPRPHARADLAQAP
jgi:hypothetical protein